MTAEKFVPKPHTGDDDLLSYGNTPVEQLGDTPPARDYSKPGSWDRELAQYPVTNESGTFDVVDAPVDQLDDFIDTPIFNQLPEEQSAAGRGLSDAQAEAMQELALGTDVDAAHSEALSMVAKQERKEKRSAFLGKVRRKLGAFALAGSEIVTGNVLLASDKAGDIAMNGMRKLDTKLTKVGDKLNDAAEEAKLTTQDMLFDSRTKWDTFTSKRSASKASKKLEKQILKQDIAVDRQIIKDMKRAKKDDKRFERSMRNKARLERASATWDMAKNTVKLGSESARDSFDEKVERTREHNQKARQRAQLGKTAIGQSPDVFTLLNASESTKSA